LTDFDLVQLAAPVVFVAIIAAIVIFGPRRGRMLPDEKQRVLRLLGTFVSYAIAGVSGTYMERWLGARFGLSWWASFGIMLAILLVVVLLGERVRSLIARRAERAW
jgi:hypothetical protein